MAFQEKQLGQSRPATTIAASIYSPATGVTAIVSTIHVCNTSTISSKFRIFLDNDGTTYDKSTALYWDVSIEASETIQVQTHIGMDNSSGSIAIRSNNENALTFTIHGAEI